MTCDTLEQGRLACARQELERYLAARAALGFDRRAALVMLKEESV